VAVVDSKGTIAAYTGPGAPKWAGDRQGKTPTGQVWSAQGNILVGPQVPESMGKAFEATDGELAERLWAALKAGDDAGGDSRGRQSASMLVVRKQGGRNINNDRYVYINVDDAPNPFPELRRLLDINLGLLYREKLGRLRGEGKTADAVLAAMNLGLLSYIAGDKTASLESLKKARQLNGANFRERFEAAVGRREEFKAILNDQEFLKQLFP
jgi:uncharacterized Ntn-hydrolase superfamily protein